MSSADKHKPLVQTWHTGADGNEYWEYTPYNTWEEDAYDPDHGVWDFSWTDLFEGFPEYNTADDLSSTGAQWYDYIYYWRYVIDIVFFGIPQVIVCILAVAWNLAFNINLNDNWADGNFWLIWNTAYLIIQCIHSVLLAFEVPLYLRVLKLFRIANSMFAVVYNIIFIILAWEWY